MKKLQWFRIWLIRWERKNKWFRVCEPGSFFVGRKYDYKTWLQDYTKKNYYYLKTEEDNNCPECSEKMKVRDSRKRTVLDEWWENISLVTADFNVVHAKVYT